MSLCVCVLNKVEEVEVDQLNSWFEISMHMNI